MAHNTLQWLSYKLRIPVETLVETAENAEQHYRPFWQTFKNGKRRYIEWPDEQLMRIQTSIRRALLVEIPLSPIVHGCIKGRSHLTNAKNHVRTLNVASVDVKDFFPSVTNAMVYRVFTQIVGAGPEIARLLTRLTTRQGHLPQGAPTSDAIANLVLKPVDVEVERIAMRLDLTVSRYLDNYDFGGVRTREAIGPTITALQRIGLAVRHKKTFNAGPHSPHRVTGFNVNGPRPSVPKKAREFARVEVYRLIVEKARGVDTRHLERSVKGRLVQISLTNAGVAARFKRQLRQVGIVL